MEILNPNLETLTRTARALEPLLPDLVFVGGTLTGILVSDPGASAVRATKDVDVIAQIAGHPGYLWANREMSRLGFSPDPTEGAPTCRWKKGELLVDLMGDAESDFGPTNPWYSEGFAGRETYVLPASPQGPALSIYGLSAPVWLLTKWVAFQDRGKKDMVGSQDIEDILSVLDGRLELPIEISIASAKVRQGLAELATGLLSSEAFIGHCLPCLGEREELVINLLRALVPGDGSSSAR